MTLEDINALVLTDGYRFQMATRLVGDLIPQGEDLWTFPPNSDGSYSVSIFHQAVTKPDEPALAAEFEVYKQELRDELAAAQAEAVRVAAINSRWFAMVDIRLGLAGAGIVVANPETERMRIIVEDDTATLDLIELAYAAGVAAISVRAADQQFVDIGDAVKARTERAFAYIAGLNVARSFTRAQIDAMEILFAAPLKAFQNRRPDTAVAMITAIVPDGFYVTTAIKARMIAILSGG
jgi:hypothetical protein